MTPLGQLVGEDRTQPGTGAGNHGPPRSVALPLRHCSSFDADDIACQRVSGVKCRGTADCTATAWLMRPIAAPRMGHIGQKFEAPAVKHFPPDALGYPGDNLPSRQPLPTDQGCFHEFFSLKPFE